MELNVIRQADPQVADAIEAELNRQRSHIELIASENFVSPAVMAAMGSCLTNKYAEGYPAHRYYGGCECVDVVENLARDRAKQLFGCEYVNVQPHSGAQANTAVYFAMLQPGDTVMGMDLSQGGHLTHGSPANMSGKNYNFVSYGVSAEDGRIDYDALAKQVAKVRPKLLVAGASAYPRAIDFEKLAEIAHGYGAMLMVDMAHIAGLVAGGMHQNPVPYADVVTTTTHKTLRGPRGGLILTNNAYLIKRINSAIFPGTQGGPLEHVIAAKAVCFGEALKPEFKEYARKIVENAQALAASNAAARRKTARAGRARPVGRRAHHVHPQIQGTGIPYRHSGRSGAEDEHAGQCCRCSDGRGASNRRQCRRPCKPVVLPWACAQSHHRPQDGTDRL